MSDQVVSSPTSRPGSHTRRVNGVELTRGRGQALVETALVLPIILILLLGAIDLGRLFFSWVTLHQAARVGANFASIDTTTTSADIPDLIQTETDVSNCEQGTPTLVYTSAGVPVANPQLGDYAEVTLTCDFTLVTPLAGLLFGDPITMDAESTFPIRTGCLNCSGGSGPPPPPPPEQCRTVPGLADMSVAGARLAWQSAGFVGSFIPAAGQDTETVAAAVVTPTDPACVAPLAIFTASVTVTTIPQDGSPPGPAGCEPVPNLIGMAIGQARLAWADTDFTGEFLPAPPDTDPNLVVTAQTTSPTASVAGVTCLDLASDIEVDLGSAWPAPPPAPCQVPHLIDKKRDVGQADWVQAHFTGTYSPTNGNFTIKSQSLVGFSWLPCTSAITVSASP